jgi:site-specific DNA recombinase
MSTRKIEKFIDKIVKESNPYAGLEGLIYPRVSSKRQELEGSGLQSQEGRCISFLKSINVPHTKTFPDSFSGGGDFMKRPAMGAMLAYIDAHPYKRFIVVFDDLKRFARDVEFHIKLRAAFKMRNVELHCLNYNFDESPEGRFTEIIFAAQGELEREQNKRQVIQKMKARLEIGYWPFARRRGYDMVKDPAHGKIYVANKEGKTILKQALEGFASGNLVRRVDVARFLFSSGFWKTSKRTPEHFIDDVTAMLGDPFHAGYVEYVKWGVARRIGQHKGIISLDTYDLNQKRLNKESSKLRIRLDVSPEFPLRGLITCSECGQKFTGAFCKKVYPYYYCVTKECPARSKMIPRKELENNFNSLLRSNRLKSEMDELIQLTFDRVWKEEAVILKQQEAVKQRSKKDLEDKLRELTELARITRSDIVRRAYEDQIEETAKDLESSDSSGLKHDLGVPYRTALAKSIGMLKNPVTIWEKVDVVEKHRLYFFLFESRLSYAKYDGFRTSKLLSCTRIFGEFVDTNSVAVDPSGIEPLTSGVQNRRSTI